MKYDVLISGPQYELFSKKGENQKSVNCFHQFIETKQGTGATVLMRSPGLKAIPVPYSSFPGSARGGFELNDSLFILKDTVVYVLDGNLNITTTYPGVSKVENQSVHIAHNLTHMAFVSDNILYFAELGIGQALQTPATPFLPVDVAFIEGYWVAVDGWSPGVSSGTNIWWSTDGVTWDALNFQEVPGTGGSANVAIVEHLNVLYVYTRRNVVPFIVGSNPNAPFVPQTSGIIVYGLLAHASLQTLGNSRYWLGRNKEGEGVIYRGQGYSIQRVSDLGLENSILEYLKDFPLEESTGMVYQLGGQEFYRITFPAPLGVICSWEFNATLSEWSQLTWTDIKTGVLQRHRANILLSGLNKIFAGDYTNGWLYELKLSDDIRFVGQTVTDFGFPIYGVRRGPSIVGDSYNNVYYDELVLGAQVGVGLEQPLWLQTYTLDADTFRLKIGNLYQSGTITVEQMGILQDIYDQNPYVPFQFPYPDADLMLELGFTPWGATAVDAEGDSFGGPPEIGMAYSDDGGMSYNARLYRSLGRAGEFSRRVAWMRMGIARDRIVDFTWNHPCVQALTTAWWTTPEQTPS